MILLVVNVQIMSLYMDESDHEDFEKLVKSTNLELGEKIDFERGLSEDLVLNVNDFVLLSL